MGIVIIYGLYHPLTDVLRYIGKTDDIKRRMRDHYTRGLYPKHPVNYWVRKLRSQGLRPVAKVLMEVDESDWQAIEIDYIARHRKTGADLLNFTDGGEGFTGEGLKGTDNPRAKLTEEKVILLREIFASESPEIESLARRFGISPTQTARIIEGKAWASVGGPRSKRPGTAKGDRHSQAKLSEQDIIAIREAFAEYKMNQGELARLYNVDISTISLIVVGKKWKHIGGPISQARKPGRRGKPPALAEATASMADK